MILSDIVETSLHPKTINYYRRLGYIGHLYDKIYVKVLDLPKNSRVRINVKCDKCSKINYIIYNNYNKQILRQNYYCCHECSFEKNKITNVSKFGCEFSFQSEIVKDKIKNTFLKKYGVEHALQYSDFFSKAVSKASKRCTFDNSEITYQGTFEEDFINYCIQNKIVIENGPIIEYKMKNKNRKYFSDFYIRDHNLIIEIKSFYLYKKDFGKNLIKKRASIESGYNFLFIIDKDYTKLENIINKYEKETL